MPVTLPNFAIPLPQESPAFASAEELKAILWRELQGLGWNDASGIQVQPTRVYRAGGWQEVPGEYEVQITHPKVPAQSWFGNVKGAPNEALMIKSGEGYQMIRGETLTAGAGGIAEPSNVIPFRTGIQSFARRVSAAFGQYVDLRAGTPKEFAVRETVPSLFRRTLDIASPFGYTYQTPMGTPIAGRIPGQNVYISPIESPGKIRYEAGRYNVPVAPPPSGSDEAATAKYLQQVEEALSRQSLERGLSPSTPWYRFYQASVFEPKATSPWTLVTGGAAGSYGIEGGRTILDMLTPKPAKQTYVAGLREQAVPMILTGEPGMGRGLEPVPQQFLRQGAVTLRAGEAAPIGIPVQAATPLGPVPWGSGAQQFRLPAELEAYITGKGGELRAGRLAHHAETIAAQSLAQLAQGDFRTNQELIGAVLEPGQSYRYTQGAGQALTWTAKQQMEQILGYRMILPATWREGMTQQQLDPWMQMLQQKGIQEISWGGGESPILDLIRMVATGASVKGGGFKGQINEPLEGVPQQISTAMGNLPYEAMGEAKYPEPVMLNALQAMQDPYKFLGTIFKGNREMLGALTTMRRAKMPLNLQELGILSGQYQTGEQTLSGIFEAFRNYPDQAKLIQRFGMGIIQGGTAPVRQYTPQTYKERQQTIYQQTMAETRGDIERARAEIKAWKSNVRFDPATKLYTSYMNQDIFYHQRLANIVQEAAGVGSTQRELLQAMIAQGRGPIAQFLERNAEMLFPESPARVSLENVAKSWIAGQWGAPQDLTQFAVIDEGRAKTIREAVSAQVSNWEATQTQSIAARLMQEDPELEQAAALSKAAKQVGPIGQVELMGVYERTMREVTGTQEGPERSYWFPSIQAGMAGAGAWRGLESLRAEIAEAGGMKLESEAQVATRVNKYLRGALEATEFGVPDTVLRDNIQAFQESYLGSDQLRKQRGGLFSHITGSSRLQSGQVAMTPDALRRFYLIQGGNPRSAREYSRYLRIMEGATGIANRPPTPNIGTEGMPGSIQPVQIMTPANPRFGIRGNPLATSIMESFRGAGLGSMELITAEGYGANLGDIDIDPMSLLPLAFRTGSRFRPDWKRFYGQPGGTNQDYTRWLREITASQTPAQQQRTFSALFGSQAGAMNPLGMNMRAFIKQTMGEPGENLLDRRIGLATEEFQKNIQQWNLFKGGEMGITYNVYRRRPEVASQFLNIPERLATEMVDIGQMPYQERIDFERQVTSLWQGLMNTSGFNLSRTTGDLQWGINRSGTGWAYDPSLWNPALGDVRDLTSVMGTALATSRMPTDWTAGMIMQVPERKRITVPDELRTISKYFLRDTPKDDFAPWQKAAYGAIEELGLNRSTVAGRLGADVYFGPDSGAAASYDPLDKAIRVGSITDQAQFDQRLRDAGITPQAYWKNVLSHEMGHALWQKDPEYQAAIRAQYESEVASGKYSLNRSRIASAYGISTKSGRFAETYLDELAATKAEEFLGGGVLPIDTYASKRYSKIGTVDPVREFFGNYASRYLGSETREMGEEEYEKMLRERRGEIAGRIEAVRAAGGSAAEMSVAMQGMVGEGLVGERSVVGVSAMARAFEYARKDPERYQKTREAVGRAGGLLIGGQRVPWEEAEARYRPLTTLFEFGKHKDPRQYMDVGRTAETLMAAEQGGWMGRIRQFRDVIGTLAGFPRGLRTIMHPATGEAVPVQSRQDIEALRRASEELPIRSTPYGRSIQLMESIKEQRMGAILRASELSYPEGFTGTGPQEARREGSRAHYALELFARRGGVPGVDPETGVEHRETIEGLVTGQTDLIQIDPVTGVRRTLDLKTGRTRPIEYAGQMAAYGLTHRIQEATILEVPRELTERYRAEELQVERERAVSENRRMTRTDFENALARAGGRTFQYGQAHATTLTQEQIGPPVLERFLTRFMQAPGRNMSIPAARNQPSIVIGGQGEGSPQIVIGGQPAAAGGGGRRPPPPPPPATVGGMQEPPEEDDLPERMTMAQVQRVARAQPDLAELVQMLLAGLGEFGGRGPNVIFGRKGRMPPNIARGMWQGTRSMMESLLGRIGPQGQMETVGPVLQAVEQLPQLLSQMFRDPATQQAIAGMQPLEALAQAPIRAQEQGLNFRREMERIPQLMQARQSFAWLQKAGTAVLPSFANLPPAERASRPAMALQAMLGEERVAAQSAADLGPAGERMQMVQAAMTRLQQVYSGTRAGRVGEQPVTEARADLTRRWLEQFRAMDSAIEAQTKTISTYRGRQLELNEVIERGEALTGKHYNTFLRYNRAFEQAEFQRDKAAEKLTRLAGWQAPAGRELAPRELSAILAGTPAEEVETAAERYEVAQGRYRMAGLQMATTAMRPGRPVPGDEGVSARDIGRLARATMGGFGLMYLRSVFDIITGGAQAGYQPYMEQRQMMETAAGQQYGGMAPWQTPEQRIQMAQAQYGGAGFQALQAARANVMQTPRGAGALGMVEAALGAGGAGIWMGSMLGAPWLGAVGAAIAPLAVGALGTYGAMTQPETSGIGMASRLFTGSMTSQQMQSTLAADWAMRSRWAQSGMPITPDRSAATAFTAFLRSPLDTTRAGWLESPEAQDITRRIDEIRRLRENQGLTLEQALTKLGYGRREIALWTARYGQAEAPALGLPPEAGIATELMQSRYNLRLTEGEGGTRQFLGGAIAQQAAWVNLAPQMGMAPWRTLTEQREVGGQYLQRWTERGGLTAGETERMATGLERYAGLGMAAPRFAAEPMRYARRMPRGTGFVPLTREEQYMQQLGELSPAMYAAMQGQYQAGAALQGMGFQWQAPPIAQFQGPVTPATLQLQQDLATQMQMQAGAYGDIRQGWLGLGMAPGAINMQQYAQMNLGQLAQVAQAQQFAQQMQGLLATRGGLPQAQVGPIGQRLAGLQTQDPRMYSLLTGMLGGNQLAFAGFATQFPQQFAQLPLNMPGMGGTQIPTPYLGMTDIREFTSLQGQYQQQVTGMPWGMSSLAMPGVTSAQMGARIFGPMGQYGTAGQAAINALIGGGQFGFQQLQLAEQAKYQGGMAGIQMQQIALQRQYYADMWPIEDRMRNLGYRQQEWGFGQQREQLAMQDRFFQQNWGLNYQQAQMQRGWTRQDWAFQDMQRAQQWGWRQEDFQENLRFMTGRERRLAERQMGRETIVYGQEGEQIDKQRTRQQELWKLEDERFRIQRSQHQEQLKFQQEAIRAQEKFFEERKKLELEQVKISRQYQLDQLDLQEKQAGASAAYNKTQLEYQEIMLKVSQFSQAAAAKNNLFNEDTMTGLLEAFAEIYGWVIKIEKKAGGLGGGGGGGGGSPPKMEQFGGRSFPGDTELVGEAGPELRKPYFTGEVIPLHKFDPWQHGFPLALSGKDTQKQMVHLVLNLGDRLLKDFVLELVDKEIQA